MNLINAITNERFVNEIVSSGQYDKHEYGFEMGTWDLDIICILERMTKTNILSKLFRKNKYDYKVKDAKIFQIPNDKRVLMLNELSKILKICGSGELEDKNNPLNLKHRKHYKKLHKIFSNDDVVVIIA